MTSPDLNAFDSAALAAAQQLPEGAVKGLKLRHTPQGVKGNARVRAGKRWFAQRFLLDERGRLLDSRCSCGEAHCAHLARVLSGAPLARAQQALAQADPAGQAAPAAHTPAAQHPESQHADSQHPDSQELGQAAEGRQGRRKKKKKNRSAATSSAQGAKAAGTPQGQALRPAQSRTGRGRVSRARSAEHYGPLLRELRRADTPRRGQALRYRLNLIPDPEGGPFLVSVGIEQARYTRAGILLPEQPLELPPAESLEWRRGWLDTLPPGADSDRELLRGLSEYGAPAHLNDQPVQLLRREPLTDHLLAALLATGRLHAGPDAEPLAPGPARPLRYAWTQRRGGVQTFGLRAPAGLSTEQLFSLHSRWYLDREGGQLGEVVSLLPAEVEAALLALPPVLPEQAAATRLLIAAQMQDLLGEQAERIPLPQAMQEHAEVAPHQPVLTLLETEVVAGRGKHRQPQQVAVAELHHEYAGQRLDRSSEGAAQTLYRRDLDAEAQAARRLGGSGLSPLTRLFPPATGPQHPHLDQLYGVADPAEWHHFLTEVRPRLEAAGFRIDVSPSFPYQFAEVEEWYGSAEQDKAGDWFDLELGVTVAGQRHSLLPLLAGLLERQPELLNPATLAALPDDRPLLTQLPGGRTLALPAGRIRDILSVLVELHQQGRSGQALRLSVLDAGRLAELDRALGLRWLGQQDLLELGQRLQDFDGIAPARAPRGLGARLRPYQRQGLGWLQFLREYGLGGVLADDMGLGKAQPLDARVLTPLGWRTMGELRLGDYVIGRSGQPTQVTGVYPQGERPIYRLTLTDGVTVEADADHLWNVNTPVRKRRGQPERTLTTAQIAADLTDAAGNLKHYLPLVGAVQFAPRALPIDPYTLGALLGDGSFVHGVELTTEDELVAALPLPAGVYANTCVRLAPTVSTARLVTAGQWTPNPLKDALRELGLHGRSGRNKFIPADYLLGSPEQRLALLQGLLDTDGHAGAVVEYTSVSEALARGVVELVQSLGGVARIRERTTGHTYQGERRTGTAWRVTLKLPPQLEPFRLRSKRDKYRRPTKYPPTRGIKRIEFVGYKPAQCIRVAAADHLYVTEGYTVTHNTLQTLAHLLTEKRSGRAGCPSLVVAPTSVLGNWQAEARRFTPGLRVLTLHGPGRHQHFGSLEDYDLVLTSYALLPRDIESLREQPFHLVILDEAQNIKNPRSAAARAARALQARHRLALTGTPLENHLGELWSLFHFLMPGLLGSERQFGELYRTPIEKGGDAARQRALAARIRPFVLRRDKRQVARELPSKTEVVVRLELEGSQRDLYETVRLNLEGRVRRELEARGLARSSVTVLDALLKLRQVATDPRLVRLSAAAQVEHNAKREWLRSQLPQLVQEGHRVLIFSQFAALLGLLEADLKELGLSYSKLTGQTRKRAEAIERFQSGGADVFLISLKAGGVGLNLTAADTVIHLDPWWNPAAEAQATDRAYRIGQDQPVFVYKLIAAGSVEERILDLQARKAALASGVLDGGLSSAAQLTPEDLDALLAPLPAEGSEDDSERPVPGPSAQASARSAPPRPTARRAPALAGAAGPATTDTTEATSAEPAPRRKAARSKAAGTDRPGAAEASAAAKPEATRTAPGKPTEKAAPRPEAGPADMTQADPAQPGTSRKTAPRKSTATKKPAKA